MPPSEAIVHDLRVTLLRLVAARSSQPSAIVLDSRTLQSSVESESRAGYDLAQAQEGQ
jgi:hypothetical protein